MITPKRANGQSPKVLSVVALLHALTHLFDSASHQEPAMGSTQLSYQSIIPYVTKSWFPTSSQAAEMEKEPSPDPMSVHLASFQKMLKTSHEAALDEWQNSGAGSAEAASWFPKGMFFTSCCWPSSLGFFMQDVYVLSLDRPLISLMVKDCNWII